MYKLLEKIRQQPESAKKIIAASITAIIMGTVGWIWILTMKDNFNYERANTDQESDVVSPLEALKKNFAALKDLPETIKNTQKNENGSSQKTLQENKNYEILKKIKNGLNKSWHWAYDPIKR